MYVSSLTKVLTGLKCRLFFEVLHNIVAITLHDMYLKGDYHGYRKPLYIYNTLSNLKKVAIFKFSQHLQKCTLIIEVMEIVYLNYQ